MKSPIIRIAILFLVSAIAAVSFARCGTIRGIGRDVGTVGNGIEQSTR